MRTLPRNLARRFGGITATQWGAFWVIGLASPVTIYALDFWEHTIGLALMAWGTIALLALLDARAGHRRWMIAGAAGLAFGSAGTMRSEAMVYLAVTAAVVGIILLLRDRRIVPWIAPAASLAIGTLLPIVANSLLDSQIIGNELRASRSAGAVQGLGSHLEVRIREGLQTTVGLFGASGLAQILTGLIFACLIGLPCSGVDANPRRPVSSIRVLTGAGLLYLFTFTIGLGWINGLVATAPLRGGGGRHCMAATRPRHRSGRRDRFGPVALPAVWMVRWTGGQALQWSGRYVLCSMFVLVVVGVVALPSFGDPSPRS